MDLILGHFEIVNRKKARNWTIIITVLILIIAILPWLTYPDPPPGQEGILVNLGLPEQGDGEENAPPPTAAEDTQAEEVDTEEAEPEEQPEVVEEQPEKEVVEEKAKEKEVVTSDTPEEIALKKQKAEDARKKRAEEAKKKKEEAKKKKEADERKKKAKADRKKREEEARKKAEADKLRDQIGDLFGNGDGKGKTGKPGNQGDPNGDPDASKLEGISTGSGKIGGGLGERGVVRTPKISDNSQKTGRIVVRLCVNSSGNVVSAEYTQRGSTSSDSKLRQIAIKNAKRYKFSKSSTDKQCGTITYDFKVK